MKYVLSTILLIFLLAQPVCASELSAPTVPKSAAAIMPEETSVFGDALWELVRNAVAVIRPDVKEATRVCFGIVGIVLLISLLQSFPGMTGWVCDLVGVAAIGTVLLQRTSALVNLGTQTITEITDYGKLLLPVMTAAMAAQGGITGSTALYAGTALFDSILSNMIAKLLIPMVYLYLALSVANSAVGEDVLKQFRDFIKWLMVWCLKIILYVFTGYMGITGVISGTTDAAALKAAKLTISGVVPVVGGILSDASEAVLISAGVVKNSAGIYGLLVIMAVCISPFLRIGMQYMLLKATAAVCGVFGSKRMTEYIGSFSTAMGLLLAMTGSVCLLLLFSTVCFLKGVG